MKKELGMKKALQEYLLPGIYDIVFYVQTHTLRRYLNYDIKTS